jgi:hypothetical protein
MTDDPAQFAKDRAKISELVERLTLLSQQLTQTEGDCEFRLRERQSEIDFSKINFIRRRARIKPLRSN